MTEVKYLRKIQSFVRRSGRISKAQSIGLNELWHDYGVDLTEKNLILINFFYQKITSHLKLDLEMVTAYLRWQSISLIKTF